MEIVERIMAAVKRKGLDGIAVTEHYTDYYGHKVKEIVDTQLDGKIVVIPGQELDRMLLGRERGVIHVVELYLPGDLVFRFIAHPGHPYIRDLSQHIDEGIHGIELKNPLHDRDGLKEEQIKGLAKKHDLILLTNSDAHRLEDIGTYHNEIEIEELCARVRKG
jgi:histidinol phosphatase-like PHP family hydrolase